MLTKVVFSGAAVPKTFVRQLNHLLFPVNYCRRNYACLSTFRGHYLKF
jgi:hypothetical protein